MNGSDCGRIEGNVSMARLLPMKRSAKRRAQGIYDAQSHRLIMQVAVVDHVKNCWP